MIRQTVDGELFKALRGNDVVAGKLLLLFNSYGTGYNFCRFFESDAGLLLGKLDGDFVIYGGDNAVDAEQAEELAGFIYAEGFHSIFTSRAICNALLPYIKGEDVRYNRLMSYEGEYIPAKTEVNPPLDKVFSVLKTVFPLDYGAWLTDTSHRVRHGISTVFLYNDISSCTAMYDCDGTVFLGLVGTIPEEQGKGNAKALLKAVAGSYHADGKAVLLVCRDTKQAFYEKCGFACVGEVCQIYRAEKG